MALATVGAYLKNCTLSCKEYLHAYKQQFNINPQRPTQLSECQYRTLYTTWDLSYHRLKRDDPDAAHLLGLLAYFDYQSVWYELLRAGINDDSPTWLINAMTHIVEFENRMTTMVEYCFMEVISSNESYNMHVCVHDWAFACLNKAIDAQSYWYVFDCIAKSIDHQDWLSLSHVRHAGLVPHAVRLMHDRFVDSHQFDNLTYGRLEGAVYTAELLKQRVQLVAAALMYTRVLAEFEKALGLEHASTLLVVNNVGLLYYDQGKFDKAEQMYVRALSGQKKALGQDHLSTLTTIHNLGSLYRIQLKQDEAEQMYKRAL